MNLQGTISLLGDLATILAVLAGGWVATFIFLQFAPLLSIRITPMWSVTNDRWVTLRIEIENKSRIRVHKQSIHLQVLEHKIQKEESLSEWVPFEENYIIASEKPVAWHEPDEICKSTLRIDPGEIIVVERLHYCPKNSILHVGVQVKAKLGIIGKIVTRVRGWQRRWTTTRIIMQ